MVVNILIEPEYKNTVWCKETLDGISSRVNTLRYSINIIAENDIKKDIKQLIVIGTTPLWVSKIIDIADSEDIRIIAVSCHPQMQLENVSYVLINHDFAIQNCIRYLHECGRDKIALFGVNTNSYADLIKAKYFDKSDVFCNNGYDGLNDCYSAFYKCYEKYNSVICSNYISAVSFINHSKQEGINIPDDLYIITFGDSLIGKMINPSITTITLDHVILGMQAVSIYRYLAKQGESISLTVSVPCKILPQKTTEFKEYFNKKMSHSVSRYNNTFLCDKEVNVIQNLEKLIKNCESIDYKIINGLQRGKPYYQIANDCFSSVSALKYRIKRLLKLSGFEKLDDLIETYKKYFI